MHVVAIMASWPQLVHRDQQHVLDQNNGLQRPPTGNLEASRAVCDTLEETVEANPHLTLSIFPAHSLSGVENLSLFNHLLAFSLMPYLSLFKIFLRCVSCENS